MALLEPTPASSHAHRTAKVVEIVGSSNASFEDAIRGAIQDASKSTRGITGAHIDNLTVKVNEGEVTEFRVDMKIAFGVEWSPHA